MFIHIGNDHAIRSSEIITILDYGVVTSSSIMEEMVENNSVNKEIVEKETQTKSVIITINKIYYSSLSVSTLKKRSSIAMVIRKFNHYSEDSLEV